MKIQKSKLIKLLLVVTLIGQILVPTWAYADVLSDDQKSVEAYEETYEISYIDILENTILQASVSTGEMRSMGVIPNTSHDSRHLGSNWVVSANSGIDRYEAWINGRWHVAFCIQPGVPTVASGDRPHQDGGWNPSSPTGGFQELSTVQRETIELILMHGYQNLAHRFGSITNQASQDAYVATVVAIWEVTRGWWNWQTILGDWDGTTSPPTQTDMTGDLWRRLIAPVGSGFSTSSWIYGFSAANGNTTRQQMYYQIRRDINDFHRLGNAPSFASQNVNNRPLHTLTWSAINQRYEIVLTDNSISSGGGTGANVGITARFAGIPTGSYLTNGYFTFERTSANTITVWTTNPNAPQTNSPSELLQMLFENTEAVLFWHRDGNWQDKVSGGAGTNHLLSAYFAVEVESIGNLEIIKYSTSGIRIPNTQFQVVGNGIDTVITTNASGVATLTNIPIGTYEITEIYVPAPWALPSEIFTIEITGNTNQVITNRLTVTNDYIRGSFELTKLSNGYQLVDDEYVVWLLPDVEFELWKLDSITNEIDEPTYIQTIVTDEQGRIFVDGLVIGDYKLIETVTHYRHQLLSQPFYFSITYNHEHHEIEVVNIQTLVEILKVDHENNPLEGAYLQILSYKDEEVIYEWISTTEAHEISALAHGTFILREVAAPSGHVLMEDIIFIVTDAEEVIQLTAVNEQTRIEILKTNEAGQALAGAYFHILEYKTEVYIYSFISTEYVHVLDGFGHGRFILREITAPTGFELAEDYIFEVDDTPEVIYITIANVRLPNLPNLPNATLPQTGASGFSWWIVGAGTLLIAGMVVYSKKIFQKKIQRSVDKKCPVK